MKASHWRCKAFGHKAESAVWSVSAQIVGFVGYCTRCGDILAAHPTRDFLATENERPGPSRAGEARVEGDGNVTYRDATTSE